MSNKKSKIKIVLYSPHKNIWFKNSVNAIRRNALFPNKYGSLFNFLVDSNNVDFYITTTMNYPDTFKGYFNNFKELMYLMTWCLFNKINIFKVGFIYYKKQLTNKDILFFMHYDIFTHALKDRALQGRVLADAFSDINIFKIVHMTHYLYNINIGAENLKILKPNLLLAENNLSKNSSFFSKYMSYLPSDFYRLSYVFSKRFINKVNFENRINKVISTGSITYKISDECFNEYYGINELQPFRRVLYENMELYKSEMDCFIYDLEGNKEMKNNSKKSFFQKIINRLKPKESSQIEYYKQDIVSLYNSYTMFTVPEEICDLPAIGFVEGMACGSAYIGLNNVMYRDLGLIPNYHYICYDGTISDFMAKVRYYQIHSDELKEITQNGCDFVRKELNPNNEYRKFLDYLSSKVSKNV